jgi:beta-lactamase class A
MAYLELLQSAVPFKACFRRQSSDAANLIMLSFFLSLLLFNLLVLLNSNPFLGLPFSSFSAWQVSQMPSSIPDHPTPEQMLERLFTTPQIQPAWFAPAFLNQVPLEQMAPVIASLTETLGAFEGVEPFSDGYRVTFEQGYVPAQIALDGNGQISSLFFQPPIRALSLEDAVAQIQALPGTTSLLVQQLDEDLAQDLAVWNPDTPLGVGSAFKLEVLHVLQAQIAGGDRHWEEGVPLQPEWKSLPSGILQDWPAGTTITLETLASLMISLSDNTATDALIHLVGREALEARSPRNRPFLTTRELFVLKDPANVALLEDYRQGTEGDRRRVLTQVADLPLPPLSVFLGEPRALDIEWFFSARELCDTLQQVADLPLMGINPGVANPQDWAQVAYKGGSEPGVMNLTSQVKTADGTRFCVAMTWNNPEAAVDELQFLTMHASILQTLRQRSPQVNR